MKKLWGGRFSQDTDKLMEGFNASLPFDKRLYKEDIKGSLAHAEMLYASGILTKKDLLAIQKGLKQVKAEIDAGEFEFKLEDEDIHMAIEKRLTQIIGLAGERLHTARSRNDQVATDIRLYFKKNVSEQMDFLKKLLGAFIECAEKNLSVILPGLTHFQPAQPITLGFYFMAYFQMFFRDLDRLRDCLRRADSCPLGSGAFCGVNYPIDRELTRKKLGFSQMSQNAMDAVSDRDFVLEYLSVASILGVHLSRIAEELIAWSNPFFDFIEIDDRYATGSSIMPNKKNPDALELIRAKTGRFNGNLLGLLTVMKGLPLAYNKDLQEDKEGLFDTSHHLSLCLEILPPILKTLVVHEEKMRKACEQGFLQATDVADYLVSKGLPFRQAHEVSGKMVSKLNEEGKTFSDLSLENFKAYHPLFSGDILKRLSLENAIKNKRSVGSTSNPCVQEQIRKAKQQLKSMA